MKENKPHLVLDWIFNVPNQTLICTINNGLSYSALEGGDIGWRGINEMPTLFAELVDGKNTGGTPH